MVLELTLGLAEGVGRLPVQQLVHQNPEGPDVGFGAVVVVYQSLRGHVNGGSDIDVLETLSAVMDIGYLVNLANPKSAILALPLCRKMLATLRSRWMTFFSAR